MHPFMKGALANAIGAGIVIGGCAVIGAAFSADQPEHIDPITADTAEHQQDCYRTPGCSSWLDTTAVGSTTTTTVWAAVSAITSETPTPTVTIYYGDPSTGDTLPDGTRIQEDDDRWDCATMGNRICG